MPQPSPSRLWQRCLEILRVNVDPPDYDAWFAPVEFQSVDIPNKSIVLRVPSHTIYEKLENEKRFRHLLYNIIWRVFKAELLITYRILVDSTTNATTSLEGTPGSTPRDHINTRTGKITPTPEDDVDPQLNESYTFETFIEGTGNKLLRSVGLSIASNAKQTAFNPLFVYGASGVGKTHLVNAIGIQLKRNFPKKRVLYLTANLFKVQYMTARQQNRISDFIRFYQTIDTLIIDDVQEFSGLTATQNTFFHIFNHLKMNGRQIIMTSDRPPAAMPGMEERLLTRFKWGLTAELEKPDKELCRRILEAKIKQDGLNVTPDVVDFLSLNVGGSIRDLEGVLNSLMAHALVYNQDIDLQIARQVVGKTQLAQARTITIDMIIDKVCDFFDLSAAELSSRTRKASVVAPRQLVMYMAQKLSHATTTRIGQALGGRSHATVIHAIQQVERLLPTDKSLSRQLSEIERSLGITEG